jgi:hypothetical protein
MKIVKRVGEWLLPRSIRDEVRPILTFTGTGSALWAGSRELVTWGWDWLRQRYDRMESLGWVGLAVYIAAFTCWRAPHIARFAAPAAALAWCVAAWCTAPPALDAPAPAPEVMTARDGFVLWLVALMDGQPGIHLRDLYPAMREMPGHEDRGNAELRAALRTLGIPVRRSLRIGKLSGRSGVALADLQPLPSPPGESGVDFGVDAGQVVDSPGGESVGEWLESA